MELATLDRMCFYQIIENDLTLANVFMRSSKKLNQWIHENVDLMRKIALYYQSIYQPKINFELLRCFNLPLTENLVVESLYVDGSNYGMAATPKLSIKTSVDPHPPAAAVIGMPMIPMGPAVTQLSEDQVYFRLQNPSNSESVSNILNFYGVLYGKAEKFANPKLEFNPFLDILNNFDFAMKKFKDGRESEKIIPLQIEPPSKYDSSYDYETERKAPIEKITGKTLPKSDWWQLIAIISALIVAAVVYYGLLPRDLIIGVSSGLTLTMLIFAVIVLSLACFGLRTF